MPGQTYRISESEMKSFRKQQLFLDRRLWFGCDVHGQSLLNLSKREMPCLQCESFATCGQTFDVSKMDLIWSLLLRSLHWSNTAHVQVNKYKLFHLTPKTLLDNIATTYLFKRGLLTPAHWSFFITTSCLLLCLHPYTYFSLCPKWPPLSSRGKFPLVLRDLVQSYFFSEAFPSCLRKKQLLSPLPRHPVTTRVESRVQRSTYGIPV